MARARVKAMETLATLNVTLLLILAIICGGGLWLYAYHKLTARQERLVSDVNAWIKQTDQQADDALAPHFSLADMVRCYDQMDPDQRSRLESAALRPSGVYAGHGRPQSPKAPDQEP